MDKATRESMEKAQAWSNTVTKLADWGCKLASRPAASRSDYYQALPQGLWARVTDGRFSYYVRLEDLPSLPTRRWRRWGAIPGVCGRMIPGFEDMITAIEEIR